ncbi:ornithine carbamoyltransferase [Pseudomonas bohemica]|uniref:ornithine carbamoyltransferase n=1 Tax=Pseudomonas bohemica TaxID=2044872 RepID=UPI000DA63836|nr:ornithine carbamoyltransferase [Pseudomonas bohemica]
MKLITVDDLTSQQIFAIWALAQQPGLAVSGNIGWSFEGNGIRTRTTFIKAFRQLGLECIELPNLLKTRERVYDLAGYLDPFYSAYVIREADHQRLRDFAQASARPVINAMSSAGHPCEVLSDGFYIHSRFGNIRDVRIGLWGPVTYVMSSWHQLAKSLGMVVEHFCDARFHLENPNVRFSDVVNRHVDILITDSWPAGYADRRWSLTAVNLASLGEPALLPTPPFNIGEELGLDPVGYPGFAGYEQKAVLLDVQRAIVAYALGVEGGRLPSR